jgi:hypothetical protein
MVDLLGLGVAPLVVLTRSRLGGDGNAPLVRASEAAE